MAERDSRRRRSSVRDADSDSDSDGEREREDDRCAACAMLSRAWCSPSSVADVQATYLGAGRAMPHNSRLCAITTYTSLLLC